MCIVGGPCPIGTTEIGSVCLPCASDCLKCAIRYNSNACTQCPDSYYLKGESTNLLTQTYFPCVASCNIPSKLMEHPTLGESVCLSDGLCPPHWGYLGNTCTPPILGCTPHCYICGNTTKCAQCLTDYYMSVANAANYNVDGYYECVDSCPKGRSLSADNNKKKFCIEDGSCPSDYLKEGDKYCKYCPEGDCINESLISQVTPKLCKDSIIIRTTETLTLDGSCSYGPDLDITRISILWECFLDEGGRTKHEAIQTKRTISATYPPNTYSPGTYYFELNISAGSSSVSKIFEVTVIAEGPLYSITLSTGEELPALYDASSEYIFKLNSAPTTKFNVSLTPPVPDCRYSARYLKVPNNSMKTGTSYTLQVIGSNSEGRTIKDIKLEVGMAPIVGNISITPWKGIAFSTEFNISLQGWEITSDTSSDGARPDLEYKYAYHMTGYPIRLLSDWVLTKEYHVLLPPGEINNSHSLLIIVYARNIFGIHSSGGATIKVSPPPLSDNIARTTFIEGLVEVGKVKITNDRLAYLSDTTKLYDDWNFQSDQQSIQNAGNCGCGVHGECDLATGLCHCQTAWNKHPQCFYIDDDILRHNNIVEIFLQGI